MQHDFFGIGAEHLCRGLTGQKKVYEMLIEDIGEFGLIKRIARLLPAGRPDVVVGIGDDVAVLKTSGADYLLATCDTQVEGVHFTRGAISAYQLGRRAVAINVSDIAAMGGCPLWVLVSLAIPGAVEVAFIDELYRGMIEQAGLAGAAIVGGNLSRAGSGIVIDITLLGQIAPERLMLRSGAREGDAVLVTGFPGESRAGLELVRKPEIQVSESAGSRLMERHFTPQPRLREGQVLARSGLVHAMVDVSDGLMADLGHICEASRVGAVVETGRTPVSDAVSETAAASGSAGGRAVRALDWVLAGGEDYELLFTASCADVPQIQKMLLNETGIKCSEIGRITSEVGAVRIIMPDGAEAVLPSGPKGWDHFGQRSEDI